MTQNRAEHGMSVRALLLRFLGYYSIVGEIPTLTKYLALMLGALAHPNQPPSGDQLGDFVTTAITNEIIPWWTQAAQWVSFSPILTVAFFWLLWRYDLWF